MRSAKPTKRIREIPGQRHLFHRDFPGEDCPADAEKVFTGKAQGHDVVRSHFSHLDPKAWGWRLPGVREKQRRGGQ